MPVQYTAGLMAELQHTCNAAGKLFDVSPHGPASTGPDAATAFESLVPVDVIGLAVGKQRYGLLLNEQAASSTTDVRQPGDDIFCHRQRRAQGRTSLIGKN
jgi:glycine cleavage system aminomethyltransferase T